MDKPWVDDVKNPLIFVVYHDRHDAPLAGRPHPSLGDFDKVGPNCVGFGLAL